MKDELKQALRENLIDFGLLPDNPIFDFEVAWGIGQLAQEIRRLRDTHEEFRSQLKLDSLSSDLKLNHLLPISF